MELISPQADKIAQVIDSAALLIGTGNCGGEVTKAILGRAGYYVEGHWIVAYRRLKKEVPAERLAFAVNIFWTRVVAELPQGGCNVYRILASYGEEVNPPGVEGRVHIDFCTNNSIERMVMNIDGSKDFT